MNISKSVISLKSIIFQRKNQDQLNYHRYFKKLKFSPQLKYLCFQKPAKRTRRKLLVNIKIGTAG